MPNQSSPKTLLGGGALMKGISVVDALIPFFLLLLSLQYLLDSQS
jgi:hypothetical protein